MSSSAGPATYSWQILRAGSFRLDGGGMFGVVPRAIWSKLVAPDEHNRVSLQTNCLLLAPRARSDTLANEFILIETGFGSKWTDKERGFYDLERRDVVDALGEVGVRPQQIAHVVLTHLHFDHAAGLTHINAHGKAAVTFPNAQIHVQRREWDDALANRSTMNRTYLRNHLEPVADRVQLIDGETELLPGITVWPMPGHTWGQQAIRFNDGRGIVVFAGDVLPTVNHAGLAFSLAYDMEPYTSMMSKRRLFQQAVEHAWRLVLDHEPGAHVTFRVREARDRAGTYVLEPA